MNATRAQWGILAAAAALALALVFSFRRIPQAARQAAPAAGTVAGPEGAGHPTTVLSGFDYAQTSAGKPKFQVHAERTVGFAQGAGLPSTWYGLETVSLTLFGDEGEPFRVRSDRADYDPRTKAMHLKGNVVMTENSGLELRTASVDYDPAADVLHVPGPVEMSRAGIHAHASSAQYDGRSKEILLAGPVTAEGTAGSPGSAPAPFSTLRADRGVYRRQAGEIQLSGSVEGTRGTDRFSSDSLKLHLSAANRVDVATAEGSVGGTVSAAPGGTPERFASDRAVLEFGDTGELDRIRLSGKPAKIDSAPAAPGTATRSIAAPELTLRNEAGALRGANASGGASLERDYRDPKGSAVRETIRSDSADASFAKDGSVETARFSGNVEATTPDAVAHAPSAEFAAADNRMTFLAGGGRDADVTSPRGRVLAQRVDLLSGSSRLTASGSARAFLPASEHATLPGFLSSSKKPTRAKADRIELDDAARTATFSGSAAIWQDADALFADTIRLFDRDRSATADRNVRAVSRSAAAAGGGKAPPLTTITGDAMKYQESTRTARFDGHVVATRGPQAAEGDSAESHFNAQDQIERTILSGRVSFSDTATGRRGTGDRAEDDPKEGVTTLFGDPAVARDAGGNRIEAAVLTFRKDSGSVEAKAKDGRKIESTYQTRSPSHGQARGRMK